MTEYDTCLPQQSTPLTVTDLDPVFGQPTWQIQAAGIQQGNGVLYCYGNGYDAPQIAVRGDGSVILSAPSNNGFPRLTLVQPNGEQISYNITYSSDTENGNTVYLWCCMGAPMVNTDGTTYVEYEVRNITNGVITSDMLYLFQINSDNSSSSTLLSSTTQNEALFPGNIIPDGSGGVLATWTISPSNPPVPQYPYQAVDVVSGTVGTPYNLPFSPTSVAYGQSPTLMLGENGVGFAAAPSVSSDGKGTPVNQISSFSISNGAPNWNYQVATQYTPSLIAAADGNGLAAKTTDQSGNDAVIRFDASGNPTYDNWVSPVSGVDFFVADDSWVAIALGAAGEYFAAPIQLSTSAWPAASGIGSNASAPDLSVTGFSQTGANQTSVSAVLQKILNALPNNSACNSWLQGANHGPSGQVWIQDLLSGNLFGHGIVSQGNAVSYTIGAFSGSINPDHTSVAGLPTSGVVFTVNDVGAFFNQYANGDQSKPFEVGIRKYPGDSLRAQATMLIHEVAHEITVSGFQPDFGNPKAGRANDKAVDTNCRQLIEGLQ